MHRTVLRRAAVLVLCLQKKYRGYFIPPRPHKNAVEGQRAKEAFIEERRCVAGVGWGGKGEGAIHWPAVLHM